MDWQTNKCEIVINMSNLTVGVKYSIGLRTMFSPNLYSVSRGGNFGMFAHSTTFISWFSHIISKQAAWDSWNNIYFGFPNLSQESMVLSQLQLAYLYYLEPSLTVFQNYRITAFVNLWLTILKYQKVEKQ